MRTVALLFPLLAACAQPPTSEPTIAPLPSPFYENEPIELSVEWGGVEVCTDHGWNCTQTEAPPLFDVSSASCDGCAISDVPTGQDVEGAQRLGLTATSTGAIAVEVTVESDGVTRRLGAAGMGDREVSLVATCAVVWTSQLAGEQGELTTLPCGPTRTADQTVLLSVEIMSLHGDLRFPFCPDGAICSPAWTRMTSSIQSQPTGTWTPYDSLAYTDPDVTTVTITAPLDTGELASTTVTLPALAAS